MFDIGWSELLVIGVVAIIVVGPKDLPRMLRSLGQYIGQLKRMAGEFQSQFNEALREAELDDLKKDVESSMSAMNPMEDLQRSVTADLPSVTDIGNDLKKTVEQADSSHKEDAKKGGDRSQGANGKAAKSQGVNDKAETGRSAAGATVKSGAKASRKGTGRARPAKRSSAKAGENAA